MLLQEIPGSKDPGMLVENLMAYLAQNHLLHLLPNIIKKLEIQRRKQIFDNTIFITTSHEFDDAVLEKIKSFIPKGKQNTFKISVDNTLLGGFVTKGNNMILDASLKRNIQFLRESLIQ